MDIIGLGEALIDIVAKPSEDTSGVVMEGNPGGAPMNVLSAVAKLGRETAYITKVGKDVFGAQIRKQFKESQIGLEGLIEGDAMTTLSIVTLDEKGDRSFAFYRTQTADVSLAEEEVDFELIGRARIFHLGSVSMTHEPARSATLAAARFAKERGIKVSFDPNYREFLWNDEERAIEAIREGMHLADYVKMSEEEAWMLVGKVSPEEACRMLSEEYGLEFIAVTFGPGGASGYANGAYRKLPTFDVKVVDTTGAGDAFWGAALHKLLGYEEEGRAIDSGCLEELLDYANAAGSLATTAIGAQTAQPDDEGIRKLIKERKYSNG